MKKYSTDPRVCKVLDVLTDIILQIDSIGTNEIIHRRVEKKYKKRFDKIIKSGILYKKTKELMVYGKTKLDDSKDYVNHYILNIDELTKLNDDDFIKECIIPTYYFDNKTLDNKESSKFDEFIKIMRNHIESIILFIMNKEKSTEIYNIIVRFNNNKTHELLIDINNIKNNEIEMDKKTEKMEEEVLIKGKGTLYGKDYGVITITDKIIDNDVPDVIFDDETGQFCVNGQWEMNLFNNENSYNVNDIYKSIKIFKQYFVNKKEYEIAARLRDVEIQILKLKEKEV